MWVSDPTWDNHRAMFEGAGIKVHTYPYYDAATGGLRFDAMCDALRALPARSIVLLHACCHNPTGVDLTRAQWQTLIPLLRERDLLPSSTSRIRAMATASKKTRGHRARWPTPA